MLTRDHDSEIPKVAHDFRHVRVLRNPITDHASKQQQWEPEVSGRPTSDVSVDPRRYIRTSQLRPQSSLEAQRKPPASASASREAVLPKQGAKKQPTLTPIHGDRPIPDPLGGIHRRCTLDSTSSLVEVLVRVLRLVRVIRLSFYHRRLSVALFEH